MTSIERKIEYAQYHYNNDTKEKLKYYLDTNEENGIVYIPKFVVEKLVRGVK